MTHVLERVPVERIAAEAEKIRFWAVVGTIIAGFFYAIGWAVSKLWLGVAWCAAAVKVGWMEAREAHREGGSP